MKDQAQQLTVEVLAFLIPRSGVLVMQSLLALEKGPSQDAQQFIAKQLGGDDKSPEKHVVHPAR